MNRCPRLVGVHIRVHVVSTFNSFGVYAVSTSLRISTRTHKRVCIAYRVYPPKKRGRMDTAYETNDLLRKRRGHGRGHVDTDLVEG
jgi:hypothetical protein